MSLFKAIKYNDAAYQAHEKLLKRMYLASVVFPLQTMNMKRSKTEMFCEEE